MKPMCNIFRIFPIISQLLIATFFGVTFSSCGGVYEYIDPCEDPTITPEPAKKVKVPVNIHFQSDFYVWHHSYDPLIGKIEETYPDAKIYPGYPGTTERYSNIASEGVMDVEVKMYKGSNTNNMVGSGNYSITLTGVDYDHDFDMELEAGTTYTLALWSHLRENEKDDPFYDPSDFNKVEIVKSKYQGNNDYRDGFSATITIVAPDEDTDKPVEILMTRPMGKFEFVTVDLSEFLTRETKRRSLPTRASAEEYIVVVSFPYYYPNSYSVLDDRLENSISGMSFKTGITVTGASQASLGFEYVMLNDIADGGVQARVDIYDPNMEHVAGSTTLTIPMRRDTHTLLTGNFLSELNEGGIGIDPDFDGEFNIPI